MGRFAEEFGLDSDLPLGPFAGSSLIGGVLKRSFWLSGFVRKKFGNPRGFLQIVREILFSLHKFCVTEKKGFADGDVRRVVPRNEFRERRCCRSLPGNQTHNRKKCD